jgi:hypothetical protein
MFLRNVETNPEFKSGYQSRTNLVKDEKGYMPAGCHCNLNTSFVFMSFIDCSRC